MQLRLMEDAMLCPACNSRALDPIPLGDQCALCGMRCLRETGDEKSAQVHMRLLVSWGAVLRQIGSSEPEAGHGKRVK
jgi:hypothetical protein